MPVDKFLHVTPEVAVDINEKIPVSRAAVQTARPFDLPNDGLIAARNSRALGCLTSAIYYEAAGEPTEGQLAVARVVLNRVRHPAFPKSVCGVVFQGSLPNWASSLNNIGSIGAHIYYRWKGQWGRRDAFSGSYSDEPPAEEMLPTLSMTDDAILPSTLASIPATLSLLVADYAPRLAPSAQRRQYLLCARTAKQERS